jgi:uncharacterized membrane protein
MVEFLLKYSPVVISEGRFAFKSLPSLIILIAVVVILATAVWASYRKTTLPLNRLFKNALLAMKFAVIALLLFLLLEPILTLTTVVPQKSSLVVLVDDSKSMSIRDVGSQASRLSYASSLLGGAERPGLLADVGKNFKLQTFKFSSEVEYLRDVSGATAKGTVSDLGKSLRFAADLADQAAVSGVILLTDGANNGEEDPLETAALMKNKKAPVYVVGIGSERAEDIEITKVTANPSAIENSVIEISALVKNRNMDDKPIELELRQEGAIIKKQTEQIKGATTRVSMKFSPTKRGFVRYTLTALPKTTEAIKENNSKSFLVDNRSRQARILYVEGYPRAEFKYLRRALTGDESIELVSLLRTGEDKFYRQGIKDQNELHDGYPKSRHDLFKYDAVIFGSIEAGFFTNEELENTLEFVAQRGGGFLMLGGFNSFGQGGFANTAIEKLLPAELPYQNSAMMSNASAFKDKFKLVLTPEGLAHPIMQLSTVEADNANLWPSLPDLEGYNSLGRAKPGATILAVHPLSEEQDPKVILALQRYGSGRSMAFATSSSWHWQMSMPHEDMSHERFWRQLLRWLALSAPRPLEAHTDKESYVPFEQATIKVDVRDSTYNYVNDAVIKASVTTPSGKIIDLPFNWSSNGKVEYIGTLQPEEQGLYVVDVAAYSAKGELLGRTETAFFVEESTAEFTNAQLQSGLLKRIAEISGGKYYHQDEAQNLADEIAVMESSYSKLVEYDLWDMPLVFLLVVVILGLEWYARRSKGLS